MYMYFIVKKFMTPPAMVTTGMMEDNASYNLQDTTYASAKPVTNVEMNEKEMGLQSIRGVKAHKLKIDTSLAIQNRQVRPLLTLLTRNLHEVTTHKPPSNVDIELAHIIRRDKVDLETLQDLQKLRSDVRSLRQQTRIEVVSPRPIFVVDICGSERG